jgi:hypothetical protein
MGRPKRFSYDWWEDHYLMIGTLFLVGSQLIFCAMPIFV